MSDGRPTATQPMGFVLATLNGTGPESRHAADESTGADLTEDALALEFSRRHADELRYVHEWGCWLRWDGSRWTEERTLAVFDLTRAMLRELSASTSNTRLIMKLESSATVAAVVTLARADRRHARVTEDFDQNPWLLNTPEGQVELKTGELRAHRRTDGITKVTPVSPVAAVPELWLQCLDTWTKCDAQFIGLLQRLVGYCLSGSTREHILPIIYGPGGGGKTTFTETIRNVIGFDYMTDLSMETLVLTKYPQHPTDLTDLRGRRLAVAVETEEGRTLNEAVIKRLTGGDRIRARRMRQNFFEFDATHKLWIVGNHRPVLRNVDEAIRRRVLLIPFEATIPEKDGTLREKLQAEYPAILQWAIEGTLAWQREGLAPPDRVLAATEAYLSSADAFSLWLEECCILGRNESVAKGQTFASWRSWAEKAGEFVGNQRCLSDRIAKLSGVDEYRTTKERKWIGLGLRQDHV